MKNPAQYFAATASAFDAFDDGDGDAFGEFLPGEPITLTTVATTGWESVLHAVGGREWIVRDGIVNISPRPASGIIVRARPFRDVCFEFIFVLLARVERRELRVVRPCGRSYRVNRKRW